MKTTILVVDDEKDIREALQGVLKDEGHDVIAAGSAEEALKKLEARVPDAILLDIWLPGMDGTEALKEIKSRYPGVPVIMISGHANIETAVRTTKLGAYDFIEKPLSLEKVTLTVEHAIEQKRLLEENSHLRLKAWAKYEIIGSSQVMLSLKADIRKAAPSNSWVLITGENGTGKELVARNMHLLSNRSGRPFVEVNCAAIPEELIESELFGHEKGSFTSAVAQKKGKFDLADKGTIFLDEIGDMSLRTQAKILRVLQEKSFERVGGTELINVDARVIVATNKDLLSEVAKGRFREDLFYRLNVIPFHVPPLRERREDIGLLIDHFLKEFARETAREVLTVNKEAMGVLYGYDWPGNVRELRNLIERLVIMAPSHTITADDIPSYIKGAQPAQPRDLFRRDLLKEARSDFEREFITRKLKEFGGNIARTAEAIGIERSHLYRKIRSYGIEHADTTETA
ncbi:MAG TPA: Fis family transcriptional regulator [Deltaproteobacteria bacterium]|nr:MAG: Fis family transcriptional regulator [Deltaproteobacteria bacterium GWA2_55_82]OGQ63299.1 MAG: Fis family transcriptional regulator [Deltaproteobacteria bacterium RIFCSPLOWO2_02_FULL_55_12]OIJ73135.1 MAG: Fis family transcriptional regulator [Deltaproteobacteria bacterium GWC2_55_46]HBG45612.1 Fis family transcriptional regulator [Deltaproteobacteria bacterium]HCY10443.1 Fis family transcriptional regulator [Deltaproteobacteria bacterium]